MSGQDVVRWLCVACDDVVHVLGSVIRPWTDLRAVKATQVDVVKAVADQHNEIANVLASIKALAQELAQLDARQTRQAETIRELLASVEVLQRQLKSGSPPAFDPQPNDPPTAQPKPRD